VGHCRHLSKFLLRLNGKVELCLSSSDRHIAISKKNQETHTLPLFSPSTTTTLSILVLDLSSIFHLTRHLSASALSRSKSSHFPSISFHHKPGTDPQKIHQPCPSPSQTLLDCPIPQSYHTPRHCPIRPSCQSQIYQFHRYPSGGFRMKQQPQPSQLDPVLGLKCASPLILQSMKPTLPHVSHCLFFSRN